MHIGSLLLAPLAAFLAPPFARATPAQPHRPRQSPGCSFTCPSINGATTQTPAPLDDSGNYLCLYSDPIESGCLYTLAGLFVTGSDPDCPSMLGQSCTRKRSVALQQREKFEMETRASDRARKQANPGPEEAESFEDEMQPW